MSSRAARIDRLERQLLRDRNRPEPPQDVIRHRNPDGPLCPLDAIRQLEGWPPTHVRTWRREHDETEDQFAGRVIAAAGWRAVLVEHRG